MPNQSTTSALRRIWRYWVTTCIVSSRGYAIFPSPFSDRGRLYVDHDTNQFRLSHSKVSGGVLDLACALFDQTRRNILRNIVPYRIDSLMSKCGCRSGAIW
ncbi:hypothetical protein ACQ86N_16875 [Puia sp. P3]|uniref:hypothetical protein n=1 Tax=Puia sp. P3 TaxID=3423952 RepID=UPI003D679E16